MRRYLTVSVLGASLLALGAGTAAAAGGSTSPAGGSTYYAGKNSQGQKLLFSVDHTASGPEFDPFFTNMVTTCPATGNTITIQFSFSGFQIPIKNGKFTLSLSDPSDRFNWSGTVTSKNASGTESYGLAAFDNEGGLQDCATGSLSWSAQALVAGSPKPATPSTGYLVKVTKSSNGSVHFSISH